MKRRIHDYRTPRWGHDLSLTPNENPQTALAHGWGHGLRSGDIIAMKHPKGGFCLYLIEVVFYYQDPGDMWSANLRFVPASSELGQWALATCPKCTWPMASLGHEEHCEKAKK